MRKAVVCGISVRFTTSSNVSVSVVEEKQSNSLIVLATIGTQYLSTFREFSRRRLSDRVFASKGFSLLLRLCGIRLPPEYVESTLGGGDDIDDSIAVQICGQHIRSCARAVVDQFWYQLRAPRRLGIANRFVPIEVGWTIDIRVQEIIVVRPLPFAYDEIWNTIAIDIGNRRAMQLGEGHAARILGVVVIHHHVLDEGDLAARGTLLLKPGQPEGMRFKTGHDIIEAVPIYVIDPDGGSSGSDPRPTAKGLRMIFPRLLAAAGGT